MCKNDCEPIQTENAYAMHKKCIYLRKLKNECQTLSWLKDSLRGTPWFATNFCTGPVGWKYASTLRDATFRCFIKTVDLLDQKNQHHCTLESGYPNLKYSLSDSLFASRKWPHREFPVYHLLSKQKDKYRKQNDEFPRHENRQLFY